MDEKKRQEIALKRGFEQNAAADFRSVCEQPIDMPHYGLRGVLIPIIWRRTAKNRESLGDPP
jgi:hypothetical protein